MLDPENAAEHKYTIRGYMGWNFKLASNRGTILAPATDTFIISAAIISPIVQTATGQKVGGANCDIFLSDHYAARHENMTSFSPLNSPPLYTAMKFIKRKIILKRFSLFNILINLFHCALRFPHQPTNLTLLRYIQNCKWIFYTCMVL